MSIARLSEKIVRKEKIRDINVRESRKEAIRKALEEKEKVYKELIIGKDRILKKLKENKSRKSRREIIENELSTISFEKNNSYFSLLELLYEEGDIFRSLLKDSIENIPQENERIKDKNLNKNSEKVQKLTEQIEKYVNKDIQLQVISNTGYANLTHVIIQIYYEFLEKNKSDSQKIKDHFNFELNELEFFNKFLDEYEYKAEKNHYLLLYMKMKQLEIKNKLAEEVNIQKELRGNYSEKCIITPYMNMNKIINLENLKGINIKEITTIVYGSGKANKTNENKVRRFLYKQNNEKYSKIQNIFRIRKNYQINTLKKISDIDGNIEVYFFDIIAALKEFVFLEDESYLPLNRKKNDRKSAKTILRNFGEKKSSEAYDYYIFLKLSRGSYREKGISEYFSLFHEIDEAYNELFLNALKILNVKEQKNRLNKLYFQLYMNFQNRLRINLDQEFENRLNL